MTSAEKLAGQLPSHLSMYTSVSPYSEFHFFASESSCYRFCQLPCSLTTLRGVSSERAYPTTLQLVRSSTFASTSHITAQTPWECLYAPPMRRTASLAAYVERAGMPYLTERTHFPVFLPAMQTTVCHVCHCASDVATALGSHVDFYLLSIITCNSRPATSSTFAGCSGRVSSLSSTLRRRARVRRRCRRPFRWISW